MKTISIYSRRRSNCWLPIALSVVLLPTVALGEPPSRPQGLVSYWNLDDNYGDSGWMYMCDSGSAGDNLRPVGEPPQFVPGKVGRAVRLGETYLLARSSADVQLGPSYTIEAWVKPEKAKSVWQRLVTCWSWTMSYHFAIHGGKVSLFHTQSNRKECIAEGGAVANGQWQHLAAVADAKNKRLSVFLDGKRVGSAPYDGTLQRGIREPLGIGNWEDGPPENRYHGCIDELTIWNVPLSDSQIASHHKNPHSRTWTRKSYRQVVQSDNPLGYWPLDEPDGTTIKDASGNGHEGTCHGGVKLGQPGISTLPNNKCIELDGRSGYINLGQVSQINGLKQITVEAWIRWTGSPRGLTQAADVLRKEAVLALGGGWYANFGAATHHKARFWIYTPQHTWANSDNGITDLDDGRWHHIVGVYDGQFVRIYVDGLEESAVEIGSTSLSSNTNPLLIGCSAGHGEFFTGQIDEPAVYARALSPVEVYEHYTLGCDE